MLTYINYTKGSMQIGGNSTGTMINTNERAEGRMFHYIGWPSMETDEEENKEDIAPAKDY